MFSLPSGEMMVDFFVCWYYHPLSKNYLEGKCFLFPNFISFESNDGNLFFNAALSGITYLLQENTMLFVGNAIKVSFLFYNNNFLSSSQMFLLQIVSHSTSVFLVFNRNIRNTVFSQMSKLWKAALKRPGSMSFVQFSSKKNAFVSKHSVNQVELWNKYINEFGSGENMIHCYPDLRNLCRGGIPDSLRSMLWQSCSGSVFKRIVEGDSYQNILKEVQGVTTQATLDVEKDLQRSFPEHPVFQTQEGLDSLRNVLVAYSFRNPVVGYAQGMNFIASLLLTFMNEEETFFLLCKICEDLVPDFYRRTLIGAMVTNDTFERVVKQKLPKLSKHLSFCKFEICVVSQSWFLTLFIGIVSYDLTVRIFDAFMEEGVKLLIRVGVAILTLIEEKFYNARDASEFYAILTNLTHINADEVFALVAKIDIDFKGFSEEESSQKFEMVRVMRKEAKSKKCRSLGNKYSRLKAAEIDLIYDNFIAYENGGKIGFLDFQKLLPLFFCGIYDIKALFVMFDERSNHSGFMSIESFVEMLQILLKGNVEEQWDFFWECFEEKKEDEKDLKRNEKDKEEDEEQRFMTRSNFHVFINLMVIVLYQLRKEMGIVFQKSSHQVTQFCDTLIGKDENSTITYDEAKNECLKKERLDIYFKDAIPNKPNHK